MWAEKKLNVYRLLSITADLHPWLLRNAEKRWRTKHTMKHPIHLGSRFFDFNVHYTANTHAPHAAVDVTFIYTYELLDYFGNDIDKNWVKNETLKKVEKRKLHS